MNFRKSDIATPVSPHRISLLLLVLDLLGLIVFFNVSYYYFMGELNEELLLSRKMIAVTVATFTTFYLFELYSLQSRVFVLASVIRTTLAVAIIGGLMAIIIYISGPQYMGGLLRRGVLLYGIVPFYIWAAAWRYGLGRWLKTHNKNIQWLVVIDQDSLVDFFDDFIKDVEDESLLFLIDKIPEDLPIRKEQKPLIVGKWSEIHKFAERSTVSGVIVATKSVPENLLLELTKLRLEGIKIYDLNDFYESYLTKVPIFHLKSGWLAMSHGFDLLHNPMGWRLKRLSDIVLATAILTLTLPIMILSYLFIRLDSRGPAFYKQERLGLNARPFTLYKFRTMYVAKEGERQNIYTQEDDARVTRVGRFLRRMRIDELPQMFNVIRGDMSLIGPRAEWVECVKRYEHTIPFYHYRHLIKPGITGWAQVLYSYGSSVEDARIKLQYDIYYIKNYSIILDILIVLKTIRVVLFGKGV